MHTTTWHRRRLTALLAAGLLVGLGACGDDGDSADGGDTETPDEGNGDEGNGDEGNGDEGNGDGSGITISGFAFDGATAAAGATVAVVNDDGTTHTVTSDEAGLFDVSLGGGESGEITAPDEPGSYAYHCDIHTSMTGTLVVE